MKRIVKMRKEFIARFVLWKTRYFINLIYFFVSNVFTYVIKSYITILHDFNKT